jgi:HD-GYP domain-containing protein (c-di-GMP phosphodiesterase class II)
VYGCNILQKQGVRDKVMLDVTRHHHENLTGEGYPDRLTAEQIPQFIRISTISDVFDALTTRRPYKDALSSFEALKLMKNEMEEDLDQELFQAFVEMMGAPGQ